MKYRKKPVVIEAFIFNPDAEMWPDWLDTYPPVRSTSYSEVNKLIGTTGCSKEPPYWNWDRIGVIETLEGPHLVCPGDYVIKGVKGEYYSCKPDIFQMTYESAE